jgi:hypothetical protein
MTVPTPDSINDAPKPPLLLRLLRPAIAIPVLIVTSIATAPIIYRSSQFYGIPPIDPIVNPEVDGRVILSDDENAFTYYKRAVSILPPVPVSINIGVGIKAIESGQGWDAIPQSLRDYLELCQPALAEWKLGTDLDDAHYLDVADFSYSTLLPLTHELHTFSRLATLQVLRSLHQGKTDEAWVWLRASFRSSRHPGLHGVAIERLVGMGLHARAARSIVYWAGHSEVTSEQLQHALDEVRESDRLTPKMSTTLKAEAILASNVFDNDRDTRLLVQNRRISTGLLPAYLFVKGDPQLSRELMRHVFANYLSQCDKSPCNREKAARLFGLYRPTGKESPPLMDPDKLHEAVKNSVLAFHLVPSFSQLVSVIDVERSRQDALELCLLVEIYRRKHGDYPETLRALVPEFIADVPIDWMGSSPTDRMLLVRRDVDVTLLNSAESESNQTETRPCLIIYGRGRVAGDGSGNLDYNADAGLRILLPDSGSDGESTTPSS